MRLRLLALIVSGVASFSACQRDQTVGRLPASTTPAPPALPDVAPAPTPSSDVEFRSAFDLRQTPRPGEPELRGAREAVAAEWPASLYATFATGGSTASCTAALIGPSVMLTAAHCVPPVGSVTFTYEGHAAPYVAACTRHPDYDGPERDPSADFALCAVTPAFAEPSGFQYETVSASSMASLLGRAVVLTGFGCVGNVATSAPFDGKYRIGFTTIDDSSASPSHAHGDAFYTPMERNNLFTAADPARPNFCPGDSGGPVFAATSDPLDLASRAIVGVNSRVFRDADRKGFGASIISATGGPSFHAWAVQWARQSGAAACGIAGLVPNCRG